MTKARRIRAESDCAALGIADVSECAAYYIFNRLLKIQTFTSGNIQEYSISVPGCEKDSFKNLKIKISGVTLMWETDKKSANLDWTLNFCQSAADGASQSTEETSEAIAAGQ